MSENDLKICIITPPLNKSGIQPVSNLIEIISHITQRLSIISGNEIENVKFRSSGIGISFLNYNYSLTGLSKIIQYWKLQISMSTHIFKKRNDCEIFLFFFGNHLVLPILICKILNKKVVIQLGGNSSSASSYAKSNYSKIVLISEKIGFNLADQLIIYSPTIIEQWKLSRYQNKISFAREHLIDYENFFISKRYTDRKNLIGYIGRFSKEKGIMNFIASLEKIEATKQIDVLLIGTGELKNKIERYLKTNNLNTNVRIVDWVDHNRLSEYLNDLRLIVVPSYTEGLPNIILEAIACGTPVLTTSVGAISEVIKEDETGFIMENNSSECIAINMIRALESPKIEIIIENARLMLEKKFSIEQAILNYKLILEHLDSTKSIN